MYCKYTKIKQREWIADDEEGRIADGTEGMIADDTERTRMSQMNRFKVDFHTPKGINIHPFIHAIRVLLH